MSIKIIKKSNKESRKVKIKKIHSDNLKSNTKQEPTLTKGLTKKLPRKLVQKDDLKAKEKGLLINLWLNAKLSSNELEEFGMIKINYCDLAYYLGYTGVNKSRNIKNVKKILDSLQEKKYILYKEPNFGKYDLQITVFITEPSREFVQVPYVFTNLIPEGISVMTVLLSFMNGFNPSEPVYPSVATIGKFSGIGKKEKLLKELNSLKVLGLIKYESTKGGGNKNTNKYYLADENGQMYYLVLEDLIKIRNESSAEKAQ